MKISTVPALFLGLALGSDGFGNVKAFAPVIPTRSAAPNNAMMRPSATAPTPKGSLVSSGSPSTSSFRGSSTTTSTTLAMKGNLVDRFIRVFNANVNKFVSGLEDPEKVIVQAVDDMQNDLIKIRQAYAEATGSQRRLQRQKEQADAEGDGWYNRANLALRRGNEGLAREALSRRQAFVDKAQSLETQLNTQRAATDKLYDAMMSLESKIKEAASKKEQLIARARTAKSMQQVNDMLAGLGTGKNSMSAFTRMEEKVEALEVAAEVSTDMTLIPDSTVESQFKLLEASSEVENELRKMKADLKMLGPSSTSMNEKVTMPSKTESFERISIPISRGNQM